MYVYVSIMVQMLYKVLTHAKTSNTQEFKNVPLNKNFGGGVTSEAYD